MFEDIQDMAEKSAYLKAIDEKEVCMDMLKELPKYEELKQLEKKLKDEQKLEFNTVFREPTGYYMMRVFLRREYSLNDDKAIFVKDTEQYRKLRFESARLKIGKLVYNRFIGSPKDFPRGTSIFDLIKNKRFREDDTNEKKRECSSDDDSDDDDEDNDDDNDEQDNIKKNDDDDDSGLDKNNKGDIKFETKKDNDGNDINTKKKKNVEKSVNKSMLQMGNTLGVPSHSVKTIEDLLFKKNEAKQELFDDVSEVVLQDLRHDIYPKFLKSKYYTTYIRTKYMDYKEVTIKDFQLLRMLGKGGFGAVHATKKINSGTIYAIKCINKKLVKVKNALDNVMEERDVLAVMDSKFVTNLKYALQDEENLYIVMDLMLGGDLKYQLIQSTRFSLERSRHYAAQILLGLEHIHKKNVIYRDLKLENVLLDQKGNCRLSDLGLAVITKEKIRGYAGTPGYTAPEMIKNKHYSTAVDIFSFGVILYRMLSGTKPFRGRADRDLDRAVVEQEPVFPDEHFKPAARNLIKELLEKDPAKRLGCGARGIEEIKEDPFFESIDWGLLEAGYIEPPFVPNKYDINHMPVGQEDATKQKYKNIKIGERFKKRVKKFNYISKRALQEEMVVVLQKSHENQDNKKGKKGKNDNEVGSESGDRCCAIL